MFVFWYHVCPKDFLSEIPEKASESLLSEVVFPKIFHPRVFDFNVGPSNFKITFAPSIYLNGIIDCNFQSYHFMVKGFCVMNNSIWIMDMNALRAHSLGHLKSAKSSENGRLRREKFPLPKELEF